VLALGLFHLDTGIFLRIILAVKMLNRWWTPGARQLIVAEWLHGDNRTWPLPYLPNRSLEGLEGIKGDVVGDFASEALTGFVRSRTMVS
jgi:hypothetical protein